LYLLSAGAASEDIGLTPERFRECVQHVCWAFGWRYDPRARVLWIPSWWKFNALSANENNAKGALSDLEEVPASDLLGEFCRNLRFVPVVHHALFEAAAARYAVSTPPQHCSNGVGNSAGNSVGTQETRQDRDKTETETETETAPAGAAAPAFSVDGFVAAWLERRDDGR